VVLTKAHSNVYNGALYTYINVYMIFAPALEALAATLFMVWLQARLESVFIQRNYRAIIPDVCHVLSVYLSYKPLVPKSVLGICDQFPGDPWIHFCNGYFKVYYFLN
jgi:hypothetical protein